MRQIAVIIKDNDWKQAGRRANPLWRQPTAHQ